MGLLDRFFGSRQATDATPLYEAIIAQARMPHWYVDGGVADSVDGRFDMIAAILSLVLIRLEDDAPQTSVALTERFIADMDAQLREGGVGDVGLGKQVGKMVSMLGGRLAAYRDALASGDLESVLARNLYRGTTPTPAQVAHVSQALMQFNDRLHATPVETLVTGTLP